MKRLGLRPLDRLDALLIGVALVIIALVLAAIDLVSDAVAAGVLK